MAREDDEEVQTGAAEPPEPKATAPVTINPDDDDDDGEDAAPAQRAGRPEGRGGFKALKQKLAAESTARAKLESDIAELRGRMSAPAPIVVRDPAPAQQQADPTAGELTSVREQQQSILDALATPGLPKEVTARLTKQWNDLDQKKSDLQAEISHRKIQARQPAPQNTDVAIGRQILESKFPKIYASAYHRGLAEVEAMRIAESRRQPLNMAIAEEALNLIATAHGLGATAKPPAPTDTDRARHAATGTRPAPSGGKEPITATKLQMTLARGYTEHLRGLSEEARFRKWYKDVGSKAG